MTSHKSRLRELHDRLGSMIDQVGQPDYSLREMVEGLREVREAMFILSETRERNAAPQGTEGYGLCDDNLGNVPAVAAPSPYSLGYNELAERVVQLERELAQAEHDALRWRVYQLERASVTPSHVAAVEAVPVSEIMAEIAHIKENGARVKELPGMTDEGRCRELCAMYLTEFVLNLRAKKKIEQLVAERFEDEIESLRVIASRRGYKIQQGDALACERAIDALMRSATPSIGWRKWEGGQRPVDGHVDYILRDGYKGHTLASSLDWEHAGTSYDIVEYRATERTISQEKP
jgi:hypothetical protein